jgi:hypothetical protein
MMYWDSNDHTTVTWCIEIQMTTWQSHDVLRFKWPNDSHMMYWDSNDHTTVTWCIEIQITTWQSHDVLRNTSCDCRVLIWISIHHVTVVWSFESQYIMWLSCGHLNLKRRKIIVLLYIFDLILKFYVFITFLYKLFPLQQATWYLF